MQCVSTHASHGTNPPTLTNVFDRCFCVFGCLLKIAILHQAWESAMAAARPSNRKTAESRSCTPSFSQVESDRIRDRIDGTLHRGAIESANSASSSSSAAAAVVRTMCFLLMQVRAFVRACGECVCVCVCVCVEFECRCGCEWRCGMCPVWV